MAERLLDGFEVGALTLGYPISPLVLFPGLIYRYKVALEMLRVLQIFPMGYCLSFRQGQGVTYMLPGEGEPEPPYSACSWGAFSVLSPWRMRHRWGADTS